MECHGGHSVVGQQGDPSTMEYEPWSKFAFLYSAPAQLGSPSFLLKGCVFWFHTNRFNIFSQNFLSQFKTYVENN